MKVIPGLIFAVGLLTSLSYGQYEPCNASDLQTVGNDNGITVARVTLHEPSGEIGASVFIPAGEGPFAGIIFSHSAIHGATAQTDLVRFALALARAGAASIVLDGTIEWQTPNDDFRKPAPRTLACAGQVLLLNEKIDRKRLATAGPLNGWGGGYTPLCIFETKWGKPCWSGIAVLNFGQTTPAEWTNTDAMLTLKGQLQMARFAQRTLKLSEVRPEWLADEATTATSAQ